MSSPLFTAINGFVFTVGIILLLISISKRKVFTSEASWEKLSKKRDYLKTGFVLTLFSLLIYMISESAELLAASSGAPEFDWIHEVGEVVHMIIAAVALILVVVVSRIMLEGEDDN
jgi:hypothetical protein